MAVLDVIKAVLFLGPLVSLAVAGIYFYMGIYVFVHFGTDTSTAVFGGGRSDPN